MPSQSSAVSGFRRRFQSFFPDGFARGIHVLSRVIVAIAAPIAVLRLNQTMHHQRRTLRPARPRQLRHHHDAAGDVSETAAGSEPAYAFSCALASDKDVWAVQDQRKPPGCFGRRVLRHWSTKPQATRKAVAPQRPRTMARVLGCESFFLGGLDD
jgi:hypothetical protein